MSADRLAGIVVVLDEPKSLVNIAGVVRAMLNTGVSRLRLVNPDEYDPGRVSGIAHRSEEILERVELFDTVAEAVADATHVAGTSARPRAVHTNAAHPRTVAPALLERAADGTVALLFGREDRGLTNAGLDLCHEVIVIPTAPEHSSLNLAQACLVVCYELLLAAGGFVPEGALGQGKKGRSSPPATQEEIERMYVALEEGLDRIGFFKRTPAMTLRPLRTLVGRAVPTRREASLLEAVGSRIKQQFDRLTRDRDDD